MRIFINSYYGKQRKENNFSFLVGAHLKKIFPDVQQIVCDGFLEVCSRDKNNLTSSKDCNYCIKEQGLFTKWTKLEILNLSEYLDANAMSQINELVFGYRVETDQNNEYSSLYQSLLELEEFSKYKNKIFSTALSIHFALNKITSKLYPNIVVLSDSKDLITRSMIFSLKKKNIKYVVFDYDENLQAIIATRSNDQKIQKFDLVINDLLAIRSSQDSWPDEVTNILQSLVAFLGIKGTQLKLSLDFN